MRSSNSASALPAEQDLKHVIVGTAGHIDHGKSTLVQALTGTNPDRLEEEQRRGITIDLGFAFLDSGNIRFGFVDVPGHEKFVRNMLAGAGGIDLVLLVIAADEGVKPQTREHFDICRLLEIPRGIVVLTKSDLVSADALADARLDVEEFVRGSFLEDAPIISVSAKAGAGLDELRDALANVAAQVPQRDTGNYFRLPIDRAFAMKGFGTVVTGTLISGGVSVEDEVELHPGARKLRVRGLHSGGKVVQRASAGQRTAINLANIEVSEVQRGMVLTAPGFFSGHEAHGCAHYVAGFRATVEESRARAFSSGNCINRRASDSDGRLPARAGRFRVCAFCISGRSVFVAGRSIHHAAIFSGCDDWRRRCAADFAPKKDSRCGSGAAARDACAWRRGRDFLGDGRFRSEGPFVA